MNIHFEFLAKATGIQVSFLSSQYLKHFRCVYIQKFFTDLKAENEVMEEVGIEKLALILSEHKESVQKMSERTQVRTEFVLTVGVVK